MKFPNYVRNMEKKIFRAAHVALVPPLNDSLHHLLLPLHLARAPLSEDSLKEGDVDVKSLQ